jgi:hypothetical protein
MPASHLPWSAWNRIANPFVRTVLRSPLHGLISDRLALITVTGRRSGRRYTFPVGYEQEGDRVKITVGWPEGKRWWRNLRDGGEVRMFLRGLECGGRARAHVDETSGVRVEVVLSPRADQA